jgi:hypothetical protein
VIQMPLFNPSKDLNDLYLVLIQVIQPIDDESMNYLLDCALPKTELCRLIRIIIFYNADSSGPFKSQHTLKLS